MKKVREMELIYTRAQLELEVSKAQQLADVEAKKFKEMTEALGPGTIRDLAVAGPEMQVRTEDRAGDGCLPRSQEVGEVLEDGQGRGVNCPVTCH